ncbi:MAG: cation-translocating P-type ATPase, partial [Cellulomonas sp.]|nr:cation-translocating P-type ATPase [Cellulomonas sp.]
MTCASCVARVEKRLNRVPGVQATVNLALEQAHVRVEVPEGGSPADVDALVAAVQAAGYDAHPIVHEPAMTDEEIAAVTGGMGMGMGEEDTSAPTDARGTDLRRRLRLAAVLTVPVVLISMVSVLQFRGWQWVVAALALPVATWAALPFHRAALAAGRHGSSTMDTLVSLGIIAATAWSLWALLLGGAGELGMHMRPTLIPSRAHGMTTPELYFEVAAVVTTFLLAGRYAEHRSRRRAGDALRALLDLGAKDVSVLVGGVERRVPVAALRVDDEFVVRPGEKIAT